MGDRAIVSNSGSVLLAEEIYKNFSDLHPCLTPIQAREASDHCIYCYDAPCITACPTSIDIPTFIHQISTKNIHGAAKTILSENIMGGTCARACPTEILCEQACVRNKSDEKPVAIGMLQRFAVDGFMASKQPYPFKRATSTGKNIAIVGAGPAGLSCAHRLAMLGHEVTIYEGEGKLGGLNEYGLAAYKMADDFAAREVAFILEVGGITPKLGMRLGKDFTISDLNNKYNAVFLAVGLTNTRKLGISGEQLIGVEDAISFIKDVRQSKDLSKLKIGNDIIVIGGGNTAIDAAVQAKRLGARNVSLVYRRGAAQMTATLWEQDLAARNHVNIYHWLSPAEITGKGRVEHIQFNRTKMKKGKMQNTGESITLRCDQLFKAIGQTMNEDVLDGVNLVSGKMEINHNMETSLAGVFAGGDCSNIGEDLTVEAVEQGKKAAIAIDNHLKGDG
jgi:glutamate synthase (NADPH/NADH) small chain